MKFGYDANGKLVPVEQLELEAAIAEAEAQLNTRDPAARADDVVRLRRVLVEAGEHLSPDDQSVLTLYRDSILDLHSVEDYFGQRLTTALMIWDAKHRDA